MATDIVILAAGKGTRMKSSRPKVIHKLAGKPLLTHVIDSASAVDNARIIVVTGHGSDQVRNTVNHPGLQWVEQSQQLGTGHAVLQTVPFLRADAIVLILYGDVPLLSQQTIASMLAAAGPKTLALLTVKLAKPTGYGRIVRDAGGRITRIVEQKDATPEERTITEVNTGVMAVEAEALRRWLPALGNNNAQGEYYLTDLIAMAVDDGYHVAGLHPTHAEETEGVNSLDQLSRLERYYQRRLAHHLMAGGVTLADPDRFDCRGSITAGMDCFIDVNCVFEGEVRLGAGVRIGPNCHIADATVGDGVYIKSSTVIEGPVSIADGCEVGPFARLRPGSRLQEDAKIGNFVEIKKTLVGPGSKINHLSYVGDATLGADVNVGAGTITCNYDGVNKHKTRIEDGAFIGSNTALVAPISVGRNATVAAGSTLTRNVADDALALTRSPQRQMENWKRPVKKAPTD